MAGQFFDIEAEKKVLAFSLSTRENCGEAILSISSDLFEDTRHQKIWEAAKFYYHNYGGVLDSTGLEVLLKQNEIPSDRQVIYLTLLEGIKAQVVMTDQYKMSLEVLEDLKFKRGLYGVINGAVKHLERGSIDKQKVANEIVGALLGLQNRNTGVVREMSFKQDIIERIASYKDQQANPGKYQGIPYGLYEIDEATGGLRKGELSLIWGRPGSGKSSVLHNIAYHNATKGKNSLLFSIEMPKEQLGRRLDSRHLGISATGIRKANLNTHEEQVYFKFEKQPIQLPGDIFVVDMPNGCSVAQMIPIIRRHRMQHSVDLVLIDYLNLMEPMKWSNSKVERTSDISRELKMLARLEEVPVFSPARANRESAKVEDEDIGSEHLSWGDALGYDADQLIYLKKPTMVNQLQGEVEAIIVKARDGGLKKVKLGFDADHSWMGDMDKILQGLKAGGI